MGGTVAIHQPNVFPRLSTLAKLYAADRWIVLDDVQFARRDYQHRARLAMLDDPHRQQWLSVATHLPRGRSTLIRDAQLAEPVQCRRRVAGLVRQFYGRSRRWKAVQDVLAPVLERFTTTDRTADIAEVSVRALLSSVRWSGEVLHSSVLPSRPGRSQRLASLAAVTGSTTYLCGTGGLRYLETEPFATHRVAVMPFHLPDASSASVWRFAREVSALWALALLGPEELAAELGRLRASHEPATCPGVIAKRDSLADPIWGSNPVRGSSRYEGVPETRGS
ncbi:hypothetical protein GCM10012275_56120 [Longimycelium tulufanense]|uniref:Uncharacterized protein n=1 Tax=Longimycelium tulufanense TaxID=907463 RepID=A0A8J3CDN4_9PSEU|nr:WbqC family protein [Longimycelium tulufanense]GGM78252.1 hypothetical protein GCM10012275_56120 [Longimycelium tulufanense]